MMLGASDPFLLLAHRRRLLGALTPAVAILPHPHRSVRTPPSEPPEVRRVARPPEFSIGGLTAP